MGFNSALSKLSEDDFQFLLKNGSRTSIVGGYDFDSLTLCSWKFLKETLPDLIKIGNFEKLILDIFRDRKVYLFAPDIDRIDNNTLLEFVFWIKDEMDDIAKNEMIYLSSEPDADLNSAGIHEMNIFGDLNTIDSLAIKYHVSHETVKSWEYGFVFDLQYKSIIENRVEKKLAKIKSKPKGKGL